MWPCATKASSDEAPVLHGKIAVIDSNYTSIGSFNLNHLSTYGSVELNAKILNNEFAKNVENHLNEILNDGCIKIEGDKIINWKIRIIGLISYNIVRIVINFLALFPNMKHLYTRVND